VHRSFTTSPTEYSPKSFGRNIWGEDALSARFSATWKRMHSSLRRMPFFSEKTHSLTPRGRPGNRLMATAFASATD
jgi:hypothetical protein